MILKKDNLPVDAFARLVDFLDDYENVENFLKATEVAERRDSLEPVIIDKEGRAWNYLSPFCRLMNVKSSYDDCELRFDVVVEIPDEVPVAWVPKGIELNHIKTPKSEQYLVNNTESFLFMLNAIFNGEGPRDALKRITPRTEE